MPAIPPQPLPPSLVELFDRLWHDPRRRDDRSEFAECEHCGRAVRWVRNLGSAQGSSMQIVAQPVATAATFDAERHVGLVAVTRDRTGWTVARGAGRDELGDALLYPCHWDVCDGARRDRDRLSRARRVQLELADGEALGQFDAALDRYEQWRRGQR